MKLCLTGHDGCMQKAKKKGQEKRQREVTKAEELGIVPERKVPKTLDNTREQDITTVHEGDEDVAVENEQDEFADHFNNTRPPHVLLTTSFKATSVMYKFCSDLMVSLWPLASYLASRKLLSCDIGSVGRCCGEGALVLQKLPHELCTVCRLYSPVLCSTKERDTPSRKSLTTRISMTSRMWWLLMRTRRN